METNGSRSPVTGRRPLGQAPGYVRYEVGQGCYLTMFDDGAVRFVALPGDGRVIKPWRNNSSHPGGAVIDVKLDRE
jgi:hypothetical protein